MTESVGNPPYAIPLSVHALRVDRSVVRHGGRCDPDTRGGAGLQFCGASSQIKDRPERLAVDLDRDRKMVLTALAQWEPKMRHPPRDEIAIASLHRPQQIPAMGHIQRHIEDRQ